MSASQIREYAAEVLDEERLFDGQLSDLDQVRLAARADAAHRISLNDMGDAYALRSLLDAIEAEEVDPFLDYDDAEVAVYKQARGEVVEAVRNLI